MANDYGVQKVSTGEWVKTSTPLELTSEDNATLYREADAITIANYLSQGEGEGFAPGRPRRKPIAH